MFWLLEILDESEVRTSRQLAAAMKKPDFARRIFDIAIAEQQYSLSPIDAAGDVVLASHGIDLSGTLGCTHIDCLRKDLDNLFSRTWYYFDQVAVLGPSKRMVRKLLDDSPNYEDALEKLKSYLEILLYIRSIGAEDFVIFTEKAPACRQHFRQHLSEAGLSHILNRSDAVISQLLADGSIDETVTHGDHIHFTFNHPLLAHAEWGCLPDFGSDANAEEVEHAVAEEVFARYASHLTSDVLTAKYLGTSIGLGTSLHKNLAIGNAPSESDVALALDLPILTGVPPHEAMKIRKNEAASFERFKLAIRTAIRERTDPAGNVTTDDVAAQIIGDVITPSLNEIGDILDKSRSVLNRKVGSTVALGSVLTITGLVFHLPLLLPAGLALWGGGTVPPTHKYFEESKDVQLKDMYFLWSREVEARRRK